MPNPVPGMNPYLEQSHLWADVHATLIVAIRAQLTPLLPTGFRARIEQYLRIEEIAERLRPDLTITTARRPAPTNPSGGITVVERPVEEKTPPLIVRAVREEVPQRYIEIVSTGDREQVVTVIEVLSPANKTRGQDWEEYTRKRDTLLHSEANLLEIDFLRAGEYTVAAPPDPELRNADYRVSLHRAGAGNVFEVWPIRLRDPLPTVRVPLTDSHPDLYLDLQVALNRVYDEGGFDASLDYQRPPVPPLSLEDSEWVGGLLAEKG